MLIEVSISGDRNVITKEVEKTLEYKYLTIKYKTYVECEDKSDTCGNRSDRYCLEIIQEICEQHNGTLRRSGTAESSYCGHCTHPAGSADVEGLQNWCRNGRDEQQRMYRQINCNSTSPTDRVGLGNISVNTLHKG
jgi:hypothetical protein